MEAVRKGLIFFVIIALLSFLSYQPSAARIIPIKRLNKVESVLFGEKQEEPIITRVENLEETIYNREMEGTIVERANRIINYVLPNDKGPSLLFVLNTLEWTLVNKISQGTVMDRLDSLEQMVFGTAKNGPLVERISKLVNLSLPEGKIPAGRKTIPPDTLLKIKLLDKISSVDSHLDERVRFEIVDDFVIDNTLLIPAGTPGTLRIESITEAGKMGKDGDVRLNISNLRAMDGTELSLKLEEKAQKKNRSRKLAVGTSLLGGIILGPVGLIAGIFVKGEEEELPEGTEIYIQTDDRVELYGLVIE